MQLSLQAEQCRVKPRDLDVCAPRVGQCLLSMRHRAFCNRLRLSSGSLQIRFQLGTRDLLLTSRLSRLLQRSVAQCLRAFGSSLGCGLLPFRVR